MSIAEVKANCTPAELLVLPDAVNFELVDGELVERNMSVLSSLVEGLVYEAIQGHCRQTQAGFTWPGTLGIRCFADHPMKIRKPDVSYISHARMSPDLLKEGYCPIAPDLAVEVLSPGDLAHEVVSKIEEYLSAGVKLVWVVDPEARLVDEYRADGANRRLRQADFVEGGSVLPGFRRRVAELFPEKLPTESAQLT